ncbi:MAG: BPSS1780 family membrane protein [Betaproteobacteria bacterium]
MENQLGFPVAPSSFNGSSRKVEIGACFEWLRQGWVLFAAEAGIWVGAAAILIGILVVLHFVPILGTVAANLILPVLVAGMLHMCRKQNAGEPLAIGDLFIGFQQKASGLVIIGALYMVAILAIGLVIGAVVSGGIAGGVVAGNVAGLGMAIGAVMLATVLGMVLMIPVVMAVLFAPALVFFNDMPPTDALKASFSACTTNWIAFILYCIVLLVLGSIALIPLALGFLVLIPVASGALYAAYRDVFPGT